jgi:regulator of sigma E protease
MTFLPQPGLVFTLVAFVAMVAVLVVIHEGGHFLAGRLFGTRIDAFAFGFGRELLGWTDRRGVRWKINAIPLGGYVKFTGDLNEASQLDPELQNLPEAERRGLFAFKPLWQRAIIVVAGPAINFVFAIAVLAGFYMTLGHLQTPPVVERVEPGMAAAAAGIRAGDRITAIDGVSVSRFEDVKQLIRISTGKTMAVAIIRDGVPRLVLVAPRMVTETDAYGGKLQVPRLGILQPPPVVVPMGPGEAMVAAVQDTFGFTQTIGRTLQQVIVGDRSIKELGGPVKTAQIAGQQAALGILNAIQFMALFSINLGFINLLPIPTLDGGHLLLYGIEAVRRRPVPERAQSWAFASGMAALMSLMLVLTWHDLGSIGLWDRLAGLIG